MFRFPWLISRKKLLIHSFSEIIILLFLNKFIFSDYLKFAEDINLYTLVLIPFWVIFSYIFGRYSYEEYIFKDNYFISFIKSYFIIFFTYLVSLGFVFIFSFNINLNNYNHFDKIVLYYSSLSSLLINSVQFPLVWKLVKITSKSENWIFIGDQDLFETISEELKWSRKKINLIFKDFATDFSSLEYLNIKGIFFKNTNGIEFENLLFFKKKGIKIMNLEKWSENYLQRFPPDMQSLEFMINGDFRISKTSSQLRIKRFGDVIFSIILLFFASPIIILCCFLIYLEDGKSIFYKQDRVGINQKIFTLYKLRTMHINAEKGTPIWSARNDNRVTKIGHLLRKTRLDELPQLISVIKGDMSLIGPRPEREVFDNELKNKIPFYETRYFVKPGLSGWAQVNYPYGASIDDAKKKLSYDLYYLRNFSIFLDFLIFFKTIRIVFLRRGSNPLNV